MADNLFPTIRAVQSYTGRFLANSSPNQKHLTSLGPSPMSGATVARHKAIIPISCSPHSTLRVTLSQPAQVQECRQASLLLLQLLSRSCQPFLDSRTTNKKHSSLAHQRTVSSKAEEARGGREGMMAHPLNTKSVHNWSSRANPQERQPLVGSDPYRTRLAPPSPCHSGSLGQIKSL